MRYGWHYFRCTNQILPASMPCHHTSSKNSGTSSVLMSLLPSYLFYTLDDTNRRWTWHTLYLYQRKTSLSIWVSIDLSVWQMWFRGWCPKSLQISWRRSYLGSYQMSKVPSYLIDSSPIILRWSLRCYIECETNEEERLSTWQWS